jgi:hypothetical protein
MTGPGFDLLIGAPRFGETSRGRFAKTVRCAVRQTSCIASIPPKPLREKGLWWPLSRKTSGPVVAAMIERASEGSIGKDTVTPVFSCVMCKGS